MVKGVHKRSASKMWMSGVGGMKVDTLQLGSITAVRRCLMGISRAGLHGGSDDPRSGRKEVREKGSEEDRARQVQWRGVYRSVSLIVDLGHQRSYGSFGTRLGIGDTEVPQHQHGKPGAQGRVHDVELRSI